MEVGIICHSLHLTYLHLETRHYKVRSLLIQSLLRFPEQTFPRNWKALTSIAKVLIRRGETNSAEVRQLVAKFEPHFHEMEHYTILR